MTVIDRYRKELNTDYFDILLLHCVAHQRLGGDVQAGPRCLR